MDSPRHGASAEGGAPIRRAASAWLWALQCVILGACVFVYLHGWTRDFGVPLRFSRDALSAAMQSKTTVDTGWWWSNADLGAPFGLDALQYPADTNVDQSIVFLISRVVREPARAINYAWIVMVVLSGLSATWCLRRVGASAVAALVAGTLFALSPYAWYRNVGHFWLVIYLVPFAATAALLAAAGRPTRWFWGRPFVLVLAGCTLLAFDYVYYAFFACVLLAAAAIVALLQHRARGAAAAACFCIVLIGAGTALNLAPNVRSWARLGVPLSVPDKRVAEGEAYGLKIRHLVSPGLWHRFPPFAAWLAQEDKAEFPLDNENRSTRLGLVGTIGFFGLLAVAMAPALTRRTVQADMVRAAGSMTLAALLVGTIGGFGSIFNLLVSPDIRAYNRIEPFIAFFSLAAVAFALDSLVRSSRARGVAAALVLLVGLADQHAAATNLRDEHQANAAMFHEVTDFVRTLESRLPPGAMVFQLPIRPYPDDSGDGRLGPYEHVKPYLVSRSLRWSYPALSNQQWRWQQAAALLEPADLARELAASGFAAIEIDRLGYVDNGVAALAAVRAAGALPIAAETTRYVAVDIRPLGSTPDPASRLARAATWTPATAHMPRCAATLQSYVDMIGWQAAPFTTEPHVRGRVKISGWAVDTSTSGTGTGVDLVLDGTVIPTIYGLDRADVATYFQRPGYRPSGFVGAISTAGLASGRHMLQLRMAAAQGGCYQAGPTMDFLVD